MTDKPIIFSAPMVRALLDGRKTQTRRLLKQQPVACEVRPLGFFGITNHFAFTLCDDGGANSTMTVPVGYQVGDRLYVRESVVRQETDQGVGFQTYAADGTDVWPLTQWYHRRKSIPSIHMPRWASRLTLNVTDVRVQRLRDISDLDAKAEGAFEVSMSEDGKSRRWKSSYDQPARLSPKTAFRDLWNSLHGPDAWIANPWVVAVTFDVHRGNIDQIGGAS